MMLSVEAAKATDMKRSVSRVVLFMLLQGPPFASPGAKCIVFSDNEMADLTCQWRYIFSLSVYVFISCFKKRIHPFRGEIIRV